MSRREFVTFIGTAVIWPLPAAAQPRSMPVVGILDPGLNFIFDPFVQGMRDLGYAEGQNIAYVRKIAQGRPDARGPHRRATKAKRWVRAASPLFKVGFASRM